MVKSKTAVFATAGPRFTGRPVLPACAPVRARPNSFSRTTGGVEARKAWLQGGFQGPNQTLPRPSAFATAPATHAFPRGTAPRVIPDSSRNPPRGTGKEALEKRHGLCSLRAPTVSSTGPPRRLDDDMSWCWKGNALVVPGLLRCTAHDLSDIPRKRHLARRGPERIRERPAPLRRLSPWVEKAPARPRLQRRASRKHRLSAAGPRPTPPT